MRAISNVLLATITITALAVGCGDLPAALHQPPPSEPTLIAGAPAEVPRFDDSLWADGNAEVARFSARQMRYGEARDGELILITVKEPFDPELMVKADGPAHAHPIDVMKLNTLLTFQTGVYTYRQMGSAFASRRTLSPLKLVTSSQEWCGTTSHFITVRGDRALLRSFSYFGADAEHAESVPLPADVVFEDALPLWLRTLDFSVASREIQLVPSQLSNRREPITPLPAVVTVGAPEEVRVPEGRFTALPIDVAWQDRHDLYALEAEAPHALVRIERADNTYERTLLARAPYWSMHDVEDVGALLPESESELETESESESETVAPPTD